MSYINIKKSDIVSFDQILAFFGLPDPLDAGARLELLRSYYFIIGNIVKS